MITTEKPNRDCSAHLGEGAELNEMNDIKSSAEPEN